MSFMTFIKKQFIDIIQHTDADDETLVSRFAMQDMEIQNGASLTVRESQAAVFVNEGKVGDVFGAGTYKLTTQTLPILTYLKNWDKLFESPFKSDVYFVATRLQIGRKWGTSQPITLRDKDFGMVAVRAFGIYSYRIVDAGKFYAEVSGTRETFTRTELEMQLRNQVIAAMTTSLGLAGSSGIAFLDMAGNQGLMAEKIADALRPMFEKYGVALDTFTLENLNLPESVQEAVNTRASMGALGDMNNYTRFKTAEAIQAAAENEGGGVGGMFAQVGMGLQVGQTMAAALSQTNLGTPTSPVPALAAVATPAADDPEVRLAKLKSMADKGLISVAQFEAAQAEILKKLIG